MRGECSRWLVASMVTVVIGLCPSLASAQSPESSWHPGYEIRSAALAAELAQLLDDAGLGAIGAKDTDTEERYVAALYFPGRQFLAISADYEVPQLIDVKVISGNYRDVYVDLSSASVLETRLFITDYGADGLQYQSPPESAAGRATRGGQEVSFDGDWERQQMSEADYGTAYVAADREFAAILSLLIAQVKES